MKKIDPYRKVAIATLLILFAISCVCLAVLRPTPSDGVDIIDFSDGKGVCDSLFVFDPNTVTYKELRTMGFDRRVAVSLIRFRARDKVFNIPEDLAICYGITDSMFERLRPYIHIGEEFRIKPDSFRLAAKQADSLRRHTPPRKPRFSPCPFEPFRIDTVGIAYLRRIGFSIRQARAVIDYRDRDPHGIRSMDELRECYAVSEEMADSLSHFVIFPDPLPYGGLVELNSADSATLRSVRGIGAKTVVAIMEYRRLLGGYARIEQISELKCVTNDNFLLISKQICCDSCKISKIDINFAPASVLERHPYMTRGAINKIVERRKSKGGWKSLKEMTDEQIFGTEQAAALAPYLHFGDIPLDFAL
ncbi:MAG: helix-hairpin-helix domain-containing protein [Alistipes sp.]|nr:helix-hairpin-helix domain-containing protein [Alistipes sp.]